MFKRTLISTIFFVTIVTFWYTVIIYPPRKTARDFLEALQNRNSELLGSSVAPAEYETYKDLYLRNGFNKRFKSYKKLKKLNSDPFPIPKRVLYKLEVEEDDQFFGLRKQKYKILLHKFTTGWKVLKFSAKSDAEDLKLLRSMGYKKKESKAEEK